MKRYVLTMLVALLILPVGCTVEPPLPEPRPAGPSVADDMPSDFDARIAAATSISSITTKDHALSVIAQQAAQAGDLAHTLRAVSKISSITTRDTTADQCVTSLLKLNRIGAAKQVADLMSSISRKDKALARIAQTAPASTPPR